MLSQILTGLPYDVAQLDHRERYIDITQNMKKIDKELLNKAPHGSIKKSSIKEFDFLVNNSKVKEKRQSIKKRKAFENT